MYSIRALEKYMADMGAVYIVGQKPKNAPLAKHLPHQTSLPKEWQKHMHAVLCACSDSQITDEFLLVDDTTIMLQPFTGEDYPFYRTKNGDGGPNGMFSFQLKCPIRINKEWYMRMPIQPDTKGDYAPRSFYCNFYRAPSYPAEDVRLRTGRSGAPISEQLKNKLWLILANDTLADPTALRWLETTFPKPSAVE